MVRYKESHLGPRGCRFLEAPCTRMPIIIHQKFQDLNGVQGFLRVVKRLVVNCLEEGVQMSLLFNGGSEQRNRMASLFVY